MSLLFATILAVGMHPHGHTLPVHPRQHHWVRPIRQAFVHRNMRYYAYRHDYRFARHIYSRTYGCTVYWDVPTQLYYWCVPHGCYYPVVYAPFGYSFD